MASIKSLLNPAPELPVHDTPRFGVSYTFPSISMTRSLHPGRHKIPVKYKIPKDAPIFKENDPQGEIRYPPCEDRPDPIDKEHRKMELYPMEPDAKIGRYPRTIPYRSEKKSFEERTGRSRFEVYQYMFRYGDTGERWIMMWDYNIGLVRITHLFKALGYTKTTPAKVLAQNPGLRDICHSITGGAIAAQGYWMPFEAARELATRFCYPIRYALTPMFGAEFPGMCLEKGHENFGNMVLDQSVIERATRTAHYYRSLEIYGDALAGTESTSTCTSSKAFSASPVWSAEMPICPPALLDEERSGVHKLPRRSYAASIASTRGSSSEPYCMSPSSPGPGLNYFTPINVPRSHAPFHISPTEAFLSRAASSSLGSDPKSHQGHSYADSEIDMVVSSAGQQLYSPQAPRVSPVNKRVNRMIEKSSAVGKYDDSDTDGTSDSVEIDSVDDEQDEDWRELESLSSMGSGAASDAGRPKGCPPRSAEGKARHICSPPASKHFAQEVKAAHALIHLHMQEATFGDEDGDVAMSNGSSSDLCRLRRVLDQADGGRKRRRASV